MTAPDTYIPHCSCKRRQSYYYSDVDPTTRIHNPYCEVHNCDTCKGTGLVTIFNYDGNGSDADDQPCPECRA